MYLVLEYCNTDLSKYIKEHTCLETDKCSDVFKQITKGINYLIV